MAATIIEAARALSAQCDGAQSRDRAGFNGSDSPFAKSLLEQAWLSQKQLDCLHRLLKKYTNQLASLGFKYEELVVPAPGPVPGVKQAEFEDFPKPVAPIEMSPKPDTTRTNVPTSSGLPPWTMTDEELFAFFPKPWTPRPKQIEALKAINAHLRDGKRFIVLEAGTGTGKTHIGMTVANAVRTVGGTHMITANKQLQGQYVRDYPSPVVEVLKGRSNYPCTHPDADGADAAHGICKRQNKGILDECIDESKVGPGGLLDSFNASQRSLRARAVSLDLPACAHRCPYWETLQKVHDARVSLFNFSSFLFQQRIGRFGKRAVMLIDELHNVEPQLLSYVSLELTEWALSILDVKITENISSKEAFREWLRKEDLFRKIDEALEGAKEDSEDVPDELSQVETDALKELQGKLGNFMTYLDKTEWILETVEYKDRRGDLSKKIVARPLFAKSFAQELLFRHADRVVGMSATILDVEIWCSSLGIDRKEVGFVQIECDFPVENRLVVLSYVGNCGSKTLEQTKPKLIEGTKRILERHVGQRGIIHTQSFELSKLMRYGVASPRFLFQGEFGGDKEAMLREHARRTDSVIVAPAMAEGVDLKDELGRFAIILKVPYPSLGDKVIAERMRLDERYFAWLTGLKFCQSLGRIVRSSSDWGITYVLDTGLEGFLARNGSMIPKYIKDSFTRKFPDVRHD